MLVTERMRSLGDHAKSSRQPPLKERKRAKADESAAQTVDIDEHIFDNGPAHESAATVLVEDVTPQTVVQENGNGTAQAGPIQQDDDTGAAKRAIIHEWENWSALHSDELNDPNVAEYFFRHLEARKRNLLDFVAKNRRKTVRTWLSDCRHEADC
jgi:hypothetical protein